MSCVPFSSPLFFSFWVLLRFAPNLMESNKHTKLARFIPKVIRLQRITGPTLVTKEQITWPLFLLDILWPLVAASLATWGGSDSTRTNLQ
jgi:hypothetical protein